MNIFPIQIPFEKFDGEYLDYVGIYQEINNMQGLDGDCIEISTVNYCLINFFNL